MKHWYPTVKIRSLRKTLWRLIRNEDGPTAVEYAVMVSMIVGVCVVAVRNLSSAARDSFDNSSQAISDAMGP